MRNKELVQKKLGQLENGLTELTRIVNTGEPRQTYINQITKLKGVLEDLNGLVEHQ